MIRSTAMLLMLVCGSLVYGQASAQANAEAPPDARTPLEKQLAEIRDVDQLKQMAAAFRGKQEFLSEAATWRRLSELRPHIGQIKVEMAAAYAQLADRSPAYNALLGLQTQGYGMQLSDDPRFAKVADTQAWDYITDALKQNLTPFGEGKVAYTLPKQDLLIESLAWDSSRKQLLVGSIRDGAVYRVGADGALTALVKADAKNGMWGVMDVAVDAKRNVLWVASTAVPHFKGYKPERDLGRAGVFKFDLKSGAFLKSYLSPTVVGGAFSMTTLALAPDGVIYAADGVNNAVYQVRDDQLRRVFHATTLTGIRGISATADGRTLYFADQERGILGYDLASGKPFDVGVPPHLALAGVEGLIVWKDSLLVVQNGMQPARVMRLLLAADGRSITGVKPLAAGQPEFGLPTLATLTEDRLLFIANSQKNEYDRFGLLRKADALQATRIFSVDPNFASDLAGSKPTGNEPPALLKRPVVEPPAKK